jgi:hypothetical protein
MGDGTQAQRFRLHQFTSAIDKHLRKSNDFTVTDMTRYRADQIAAVSQHVDALPAAKQTMLRRVGF